MSNEAIDIDDVLERVQDDNELLMELLDIFQDDFKEKRVELDGLVSSGDFQQVKNITHSLKGAAGNISARAIHATCERIEKLAEDKDKEGIEDSLTILDQQYQELQAFVENLKKNLGNL